MKVGDKYSSYAELTIKLQEYEKENYVKFWMRNSRKLEAAKKRFPKRTALAKPQLIYYEIKFCCIHGGPFYTQAKGIRKTRTFKIDCQSFINIKLSEDGSYLEVGSMNDNHNHEISKELFQHLSHRRKLSECFQIEDSISIDSDAIQKNQEHLIGEQFNQTILLKDLSNIYQCENASEMTNTLIKITSELESKWDAIIEIYKDSKNIFQGLFFQDNKMKNLFGCYPEIIFCEAIYNFLDLNLSCIFIVIEDSNGKCEIVSVGILANGVSESFQWFIDTFKKNNKRFNDVSVIMINNDFKNKSTLRRAFPSAQFRCILYTLLIFQKEISCENMNISVLERKQSLEMLEKLAFAKTESEYNNFYEKFSRSVSTRIFHYYNINWHPRRYEWVLGIAGKFFETTCNRIESLNAKLKYMINHFSTFYMFIDSFFSLLNSSRRHRDHLVVQLCLKRPNEIHNATSDEELYQSFLTPYAFKYTERQFSLLANINDHDIIENNDEFIIKSNKEIHNIKEDSCTCSFRNVMYLPCYHILALRRKKCLPLFSEKLCDLRWSMQYYKTCQRAFLGDGLNLLHKDSTPLSSTTTSKPKVIAKTTFENYKLFSLAKEFASLISTSSSDKFDEKIGILKSILTNWKAGKEVKIVSLNTENKTSLSPFRMEASSNQEFDNDSTFISNSRIEVVSNQELENVSSMSPSEISEAESEKTEAGPSEVFSLQNSEISPYANNNLNVFSELNSDVSYILSNIKLPEKLKGRIIKKKCDKNVSNKKKCIKKSIAYKQKKKLKKF